MHLQTNQWLEWVQIGRATHYRNMHISVLNVALLDMGQVHCGICDIGLIANVTSASNGPWNHGTIRIQTILTNASWSVHPGRCVSVIKKIPFLVYFHESEAKLPEVYCSPPFLKEKSGIMELSPSISLFFVLSFIHSFVILADAMTHQTLGWFPPYQVNISYHVPPSLC